MQALASISPAALESAAFHLLINKYYALAATVMLIYDNLLTLDREVKVIWKAKWSAVKALFLFNRYATIITYCVSISALHSTWSSAVCKRYVLYPVVFNLIQQMVIGAILMLFTYAIFQRSRIVLAIIFSTYCAQIAVTGWSLAVVIAIPLPPGFTGCIYAGKSGTGSRVITAWIMQLAFISVVFTLMIWKAFRLRGENIHAPLVTVLTKHGLKHFCVIFVANLVNVLNFAFVKTRDLRSIHVTFSALITVLMVNRLVLSIRQEADSHRYPTRRSTHDHSTAAQSCQTPRLAVLGGSKKSSTWVEEAEMDVITSGKEYESTKLTNIDSV